MPDIVDDLLVRLKQTCVFIPGPETQGTGYIVAPERIATAYHVVESWQSEVRYPVYVGVPESRICEASLLAGDAKTDAAVLVLHDKLDVSPLPIAENLERHSLWDSYGFPALANKTSQPAGIPIDGHVKDPKTRNDYNQSAVLLFSPMLAAGNASPEHGFSGSPVVVGGALVGHLVKHIGDSLDIDRSAFGLIYACPIDEVLKLLDCKPQKITLPSLKLLASARAISASGANDYYIHYSLTLQALKIPGENNATIDITIPLIGLSDVLPTPLRRIVLQGGNSKNDYKLFDGEQVSIATGKATFFVQKYERDLESMQKILNRIEGEKKQLEIEIRSIGLGAPPHPPIKEVAWVTQDYSNRLRQWELDIKIYEQLKLDDLRQKARRDELQEQADRQQNAIASFKQNFEARYPEFERGIDNARGQDIVHLLAQLRDSASQNINEQAPVTRGFAQLLAANIVYSISQPWLGPSFDNAEKITREIKWKIKETISSKHRLIGFDLLQRAAMFTQALQYNEQNLNCINNILNSLTSDEQHNFSSAALDFARENNFEAVPPYNHIVNPEKLTSVIGSISSMRERIAKAQEQRQSLLDHTSEIFEKIKAAHFEANSYLTKIQNVKNLFFPYLEEINHFWILLIKTQQNFFECKSLKPFTEAIEKEVERRFGSPLSALIDRCIKTDFIVIDADQAFKMHPSRIFIENREALIAQLSNLEKLKQKFDDALVDIQKVPDRNCKKYKNYMYQYALGIVIPFINLLCATFFVQNIGKLRPALCSSVSCYVSLRGFSKKIFVWIFSVSILFAAFPFIVLKFWYYQELYPFITFKLSTIPIIFILTPFSYLFTAVISLLAWKKMP